MAQLYRAEDGNGVPYSRMAGFQLLDLQDYPGQGTALVGILDAFMDNKGLITAENGKNLAMMSYYWLSLPKFCYSGNEGRSKAPSR